MDRKEFYEKRAAQFADAQAVEEVKSNRMSNLRLGVFLLSLVCGVIATLAVSSVRGMAFWFLISGLLIAAFIVFVMLHRRISARSEKFSRLREINEHAMHRLDRNWSEFPTPDAPAEFETQNVAHDLDLFGEASLFQLSCTHHTPQGRYTLAKWFTEPGEPEELLKRQKSVAALADDFDWRQELSVIGGELSVDEAVILPKWIEITPWFTKLSHLATYLKWAPFLVLGLLAAFLVIYPAPLFAAVLSLNLYLVRKYRSELGHSLNVLLDEERKFQSYSQVFSFLKTCSPNDCRLQDLLASVEEAEEAMDTLNSISTQAGVRGSVLHIPLNAVLLWDFRVVASLEKWQETYREKVEAWFVALGEFEAIASLAGLRFDERDWVFPEFVECGAIEGAGVGHPLISENVRVANPLKIGPEGRFLLVTGSNMSGKSTLLRSTGLNVTLAQAGGPVCADAFSLPKIAIATSMRVQDSLSDGVSFFMAELNRIKEVVLMAEDFRDKDRNVLFLLDEILQGTNTVERREIVQRVIAHLVECGAIGAVTTHDLALAEMDDLLVNSDLIHFREDFSRDEDGKPQMTFDYQLREGIATTTNALKILEVIEMPV